MSQPKKIVLVGGGSGGHLTPLVAVASAIKENDTNIVTCHIGQRGEDLQEVTKNSAIDESFAIHAGKFRRYHGESTLKRLLDVKTLFLNCRDVTRFVRGTFESYFLLRKMQPSSIFLKGGFVSVPVGYAARVLKIPYVTHDSDAIPGLANRMTASHATFNLTALPVSGYPYDKNKAIQVGIPLQKGFSRVSLDDKNKAKQLLDIPLDAPVLFVVGGGLGAQVINDAIIASSSELLTQFPELIIIHLSGKSLYKQTVSGYEAALLKEQIDRIRIIDFSTTLSTLSASADVVVTRAGATNIAEFALQAKPSIVIPAPHLTGGQQLHNAAILAKSQAAIVLHENNLKMLGATIIDLLNDTQKQTSLSDSFYKLAVANADQEIASLLIDLKR